MTEEKWHEYLLQKLTQIDEHLIEIKVEVATLKTKAAIWGSVSGVIVAALISYILR